jgi:hypothetical protein
MFIPDPDVFSIPDPGSETLEKRDYKTITAGKAVTILLCILRSMLRQLWSCGLQQNQVHQEGIKLYYYATVHIFTPVRTWLTDREPRPFFVSLLPMKLWPLDSLFFVASRYVFPWAEPLIRRTVASLCRAPKARKRRRPSC